MCFWPLLVYLIHNSYIYLLYSEICCFMWISGLWGFYSFLRWVLSIYKHACSTNPTHPRWWKQKNLYTAETLHGLFATFLPMFSHVLLLPLREKCPNTELILVRIFLHSKCTFHAVFQPMFSFYTTWKNISN